MDEFEFTGRCSRCKRTITATVMFEAEGGLGAVSGQPISAPPIMGSYCCCGDENAPGGLSAQAVPLTLRGLPE